MSKNIVLFVQSPDKPFATTAEAAEGICDISSPVPSVERLLMLNSTKVLNMC